MTQIDQNPRNHSSSYELKPMSRWWLVVPVVWVALAAFANGLANPITWTLVGSGIALCGFGIACFPRFWLSKVND